MSDNDKTSTDSNDTAKRLRERAERLLARPAVVFVAGGKARLVIRRETEQDLLATDVG